ncbi:unnamed protein product [Bursaphelenchus okinawaensis]|uniref:Uncharacterized protein n=1 Tax=Bursaphelenchus okinawaensis TaxID=465554 RepID=A0A811LW76_9BILA|nr:unnamed protein product [Bursaphelenchus okinawaensis]CAG9128698.1 unnamed protein product [Bursaphelenchus okinawaensis]
MESSTRGKDAGDLSEELKVRKELEKEIRDLMEELKGGLERLERQNRRRGFIFLCTIFGMFIIWNFIRLREIFGCKFGYKTETFLQGLYNGYLVTAEVYGFSPINEGIPRDAADRTSSQGLITDAAISRNRKMYFYCMEDELKQEIDALNAQMNPDDATMRSLYEKKLRLWCLKAVRSSEMNNRELRC